MGVRGSQEARNGLEGAQRPEMVSKVVLSQWENFKIVFSAHVLALMKQC